MGIFVHRVQAGIGSMAAALGGLDALVFTAGIGENSQEVRQASCAILLFLAYSWTAQEILLRIPIGISPLQPRPS